MDKQRGSEICIFLGPTRIRWLPRGITVFTPAVLGSVFRASLAGYKVVCLIDGSFGNVPSVWHKEILFALKKGVAVYGCSSIGALRAAELHPFGMIGIGCVYRAFRCGILQDDDEVCVTHAVPELGFQPLSEALVNIRVSMNKMASRRFMSRDSARRIVAQLKGIHFSTRDSAAIQHAFYAELGRRADYTYEMYEKHKVDVKASDVDRLFRLIESSSPSFPDPKWDFPATDHWVRQFLGETADLPSLSTWEPL
jgi:hypothetical protein